MTNFWWVRHGPTHAKTMVGWTDLPADLSDAEHVSRVRAALPDAPLISSDLLRTRSTADALQGTRTRLAHDPRLREFHYGKWENQSFDAIDSPECRTFFEQPGAQKAPGGESWDDVAARVNAACKTLMTRHQDIIVVAHMGVILTQWAQANAIPPYTALAQPIEPLSITKIRWDGTNLRAEYANHHP
jgi:broad specificity phosphatase PhoE